MFDIDLPTLVLASVFIAAVSAVFFYYSIKIKKSRKEFFEKFNRFISGLNLNPDLKEDWRNRYILGLDQNSKTLVYCNFGDNEEKIVVPLPEVKKVDVSEFFQESLKEANSRKILDRLTLKIQFKNPNKEAIHLPIYSSEDYSDLLGETVLASKWSNLINEQLAK